MNCRWTIFPNRKFWDDHRVTETGNTFATVHRSQADHMEKVRTSYSFPESRSNIKMIFPITEHFHDNYFENTFLKFPKVGHIKFQLNFFSCFITSQRPTQTILVEIRVIDFASMIDMQFSINFPNNYIQNDYWKNDFSNNFLPNLHNRLLAGRWTTRKRFIEISWADFSKLKMCIFRIIMIRNLKSWKFEN